MKIEEYEPFDFDQGVVNTADVAIHMDELRQLIDTHEHIELTPDQMEVVREAQDELNELEQFEHQVDLYSGNGFRSGVSLIADTYFEDYCKDSEEEFHGDKDAFYRLYPYIDWERLATHWKIDYTSVEVKDREF